jgi:hypothetical protein
MKAQVRDEKEVSAAVVKRKRVGTVKVERGRKKSNCYKRPCRIQECKSGNEQVPYLLLLSISSRRFESYINYPLLHLSANGLGHRCSGWHAHRTSKVVWMRVKASGHAIHN